RDDRPTRDRRHAGHHRDEEEAMRNARAERSAGREGRVVVDGVPVAADRAEQRDVGLGHRPAASAGEHIPDAQLIEVLVQQTPTPFTGRSSVEMIYRFRDTGLRVVILNKRSLANTIWR